MYSSLFTSNTKWLEPSKSQYLFLLTLGVAVLDDDLRAVIRAWDIYINLCFEVSRFIDY